MNSTIDSMIEPWRNALSPSSVGAPASEEGGNSGAGLGGPQRTAARRDLDWREAMEQAQLANWFGDERGSARQSSEAAPASSLETRGASNASMGLAQAHPRQVAQAFAEAQVHDPTGPASCSIAAFGQAARRYAMTFDGAAAAGTDLIDREAQQPADPSMPPPRNEALALSPSAANPASFMSAVVAALADTLHLPDRHEPAEPARIPAASGIPVVADTRAADVRVHAQWTQDGVLVWIGIDRDAAVPLAALHAGLAGWLAEHGLRLAGLVCNGRVVELRPRPAQKASGTLDDTRAPAFAQPHHLNVKDTP